MLFLLANATLTSCGGKAATLGVLLREGFPVPDGFVIPFGDVAEHPATRPQLRAAVASQLDRLGDPVVAVRSSAALEDTADASAAGQYESVIGVRGAAAVCEAIATCRASARAARVGDYWRRSRGDGQDAPPGMAVLVQRIIEADTAGVMFTPATPQGPIRIEAAWGLGLPVVGGTVTPDAYEVTPDGAITVAPGRKRTRVDPNTDGDGVTTSAVSDERQTARTLDDRTVEVLATLGRRIAARLGRPQDIEWAVADGNAWILQARPITAALPSLVTRASGTRTEALVGRPGSHGTVTATARVVRGLSEFATVNRGEVVICPYTDPSWTPLFSIAAGVVTEAGGALSHAAIVAREYGIPAALGVAHATTRIATGETITLDGTAGTVTIHPS
ncbi:MAG: PEP/pyruvate-binding domain-containing protein [Pseudoclavibacter sp.]